MTKLTAIVVDDEKMCRDNLTNLLQIYCPEISIIGIATSSVEAKHLVIDLEPDAVFLDINMPGLSGFDFLESLEEIKFMIVFVTAYDDYGIRAVKSHAVDYLLKPIDIKELQCCVKKLTEARKKENKADKTGSSPKVVIPQNHGFVILECENIVRMTSEDCYTRIFTNDNKQFIVSKTLKEFEETAPHDIFFRIHKSHLVNLSYVKQYTTLDGGSLLLQDGIKIEVSRRKAHEFNRKIKEVFAQSDHENERS